MLTQGLHFRPASSVGLKEFSTNKIYYCETSAHHGLVPLMPSQIYLLCGVHLYWTPFHSTNLKMYVKG